MRTLQIIVLAAVVAALVALGCEVHRIAAAAAPDSATMRAVFGEAPAGELPAARAARRRRESDAVARELLERLEPGLTSTAPKAPQTRAPR